MLRGCSNTTRETVFDPDLYKLNPLSRCYVLPVPFQCDPSPISVAAMCQGTFQGMLGEVDGARVPDGFCLCFSGVSRGEGPR